MTTTRQGSIKQVQRGASSAVSPLTSELLEKDSRPQRVALGSHSDFEPAARNVEFSRYYDPQFAALEREKLWSKMWQYACREEDIPEVGDRVRYDVGTLSFFIVRSGTHEFRAFYNACLHRGTQLCMGPSSGNRIRCPFHAWEWNLDGSLHNIPSAWDFPHVSAATLKLPEIKLARWGGFIFVNQDPQAAPLESALGVLPEHFRGWKPEERFTFVHVRKRIRANWKTALEAFLEAYHVVETHYTSMPFTGDASTQYDIWDDGLSHISRLITPSAVPSPHLGDNASTQKALDALMNAFKQALPPGTPLPTFDASKGAGRAEVAEWRRQVLQQQTGWDFSQASDAEMLDSIEYFMFPNFCPWYGEGLPLVYQFLPLGDDPNECAMSIRLLLPIPKALPTPPPPAPLIELGFDDRFSQVPQLGILCGIFDEDMSNLPLVQAGMRSASSARAHTTLGRYQEARIRHFQNTLDRYLGL